MERKGKEESEKREKRGGLTGRHTLVLAHKSSVDPFFTFPECDAREREHRPARLPAGNRNDVRRQKIAALWYTSLFGNVSSLGSPVIISKYGTHFYFNLRRIFVPPQSIRLIYPSTALICSFIYEPPLLFFPFLPPFFSTFFRPKMQNTSPLIEKRSNPPRFELSLKNGNHFECSFNHKEEKSNPRRFELSIFSKMETLF